MMISTTNKPHIDDVWYLASCYSTPMEPGREAWKVRHFRHHHVQAVGHALYKMGYTLIEPIASSHYKAEQFGSVPSYEYWQKRDRRLIDVCAGIIVLNMNGWEDSVGVTDEVKYAKLQGKPVYLLHYNLDKEEARFEKI